MNTSPLVSFLCQTLFWHYCLSFHPDPQSSMSFCPIVTEEQQCQRGKLGTLERRIIVIEEQQCQRVTLGTLERRIVILHHSFIKLLVKGREVGWTKGGAPSTLHSIKSLLFFLNFFNWTSMLKHALRTLYGGETTMGYKALDKAWKQFIKSRRTMTLTWILVYLPL